MVPDFKELRGCQHAFEAAKTPQKHSAEGPQSEKYAMTDQIPRSSRSVCSNIAEAWFRRRAPDHFANRLSDASSEAAETIVWIGFAQEYDYIDQEMASALENQSFNTMP